MKYQNKSIARASFRRCLGLYRRYFSEVGYLPRFFNYHYSAYRHRAAIYKRRALVSALPLTESGKNLLAKLQADGGAKTSFDELQIDNSVLSLLQNQMQERGEQSAETIKNSRKGQSKTYWTSVVDSTHAAYPALTEFATHPALLSVIAHYLGQVPLLLNIHFYYSPPALPSPELIGSQGWHLDNEQRTKIKLFLSPHEMTAENGPTTFLPLPYSDPKKYKNYPNYFDDVQARAFGIDISKRVEMLAEPGEFYLADTSRLFHYGARNQMRSRWLVILDYGPLENNLWPGKWQKYDGPGSPHVLENQKIIKQFGG